VLDVGDCGIERRWLFAQVVPTHQDRPHRAVMRTVVSQRPRARCLQPALAKAARQAQDTLSGPQSLEDPIAQQLVNELTAGCADVRGSLGAPGAIVGKEALSLGRQMFPHCASGTDRTGPRVSGRQMMILEYGDRVVGGPQPQLLSRLWAFRSDKSRN